MLKLEIGTILFQFLAFIIFLSMIGGFIYIIRRLSKSLPKK